MPRVDKLVVTNKRALRSKYGARAKRIEEAWDDLVQADSTRDMITKVIGLDDATQMPDNAVRRATNALQAKVAIDTAFHAHQPHYLMILGGVDIVPQQPLRNPKHSADDTSETVPSDLPYACDTPHYSLDIAQFTGPVRAIGRLPDVTGYANPAYLEGLLRTAAAAVPRKAPGGSGVLAISTKKWFSLTEEVLAGTYPHSVPSIHPSPDEGPDWGDILLRLPLHFINCHGGKSDCRFYGDAGKPREEDVSDPIAHDSACIAKRLADGTVAIAECCFGAQLFDPAETGGVGGICATYLANGAYAFFGSSGVAYGGETSAESADVLCGLFLQELLLHGASTGYAAVSAVQKYVDGCRRPLDPVDLKTIAQFNLMGDPSVHPFLAIGTPVPADAEVPAGNRPILRLPKERGQRREGLAKKGEELRRLAATLGPPIQIPDSTKTIDDILRFAGVKDWQAPGLRSFDVTPAAESTDGLPGQPTLIHVVTRPGGAGRRPFPDIEILIAREVNGQIISCRRVTSR